MRIAEVRPAVAAKLNELPAVSAFGPVSIFSAIADIETARKDFESRLEQYGVVIEVGALDFTAKDPKPGPGVAPLVCRFAVLVFESFTVSHSPSEDSLIQAIMEQLKQPISAGVYPYFTDKESDSEGGYSITVLNYSVNIDNRATA